MFIENETFLTNLVNFFSFALNKQKIGRLLKYVILSNSIFSKIT